jgi:hypothetical protein
MTKERTLDNKAIRKYLRQTKRIYYGNKELKKIFMQDLQDALFCYAESNPDFSYSDLINKFGTPREIQESFSSVSFDMLKKRSIPFHWSFILFSVLVLIIITVTGLYVSDSYDFSKGHYIEYMEDKNSLDMNNPTTITPSSTPCKEYTFD